MKHEAAKVKREITFEMLLQALSENFNSIYYVDFDKDIVVPYRMNEGIEKRFGVFLQKNPGFEEAAEQYIRDVVVKKDQSEMFKICKKEFLRKQLRYKRSFSHEFRGEHDGKFYFYRMKIANIDGASELHRAVIGFADVSNEKYTTRDFLKLGKSILVVEDDEISRQIMEDILKEEYQVFGAANGKEALDILKKHTEDISMVITDLIMPVCDGYELIEKINRNHHYDGIPIIVITGHDTTDVEVKCLELGASDFIAKPFNVEVVRNRVKCLLRLQESTSLLSTLEKDTLTGFYTKDFFYQYAAELIAKNPGESYQFVVSDIENFKLINEKYGVEVADNTLRYLSAREEEKMPGFCLGGRISGDVFVCLRVGPLMPEEAIQAYVESLPQDAPVGNLSIKLGIYQAEMGTSVQAMCDRARLALNKIKGIYGVNYAIYDDRLRKDMLVQQQILENMENALTKHQFQMYLQPKHDMHTNKTGGAEALVRWVHPDLGFMNPGMFIPLFEQNGFIAKMDAYIWEELCRTISRWKKEGKRVVPVSVNVSRRDFEREDLAEYIIGLVDSYQIEHELIHIEVTETSFTDNPKKITETVKELHDAGFVIELDDFGVGYSSLTTLNSMELDYLKLDMSIISNDVPGSERNVLEFSMQLARMLKLKTVAEGVETEEQKSRLQSLGCDYIQGYYYAKPLPISEFEEYIRAEEEKE